MNSSNFRIVGYLFMSASGAQMPQMIVLWIYELLELISKADLAT